MKLARINLLCALLSLIGGFVLLLLGEILSGLVWVGASLVWLVAALVRTGDSTREVHPCRHIGRRLSRLLMWS